MDLLAELNDIKNQYSAANSLFEEATAQLNATKATLAERDAVIATFEAEKANAAEQAAQTLAHTQGKLDATIAKNAELQQLIADLQADAKTAEERALEIVASQGIKAPKVDLNGSGAGQTKEEALAKYASIADPMERGQFYAKHRELILG